MITSLIVPLVGLVLEMLVVALATAGAVLLRVVFRRPWSIEVCRGGREVARDRVAGWGASGRRIEEIARIVGAGGGDNLVVELRRRADVAGAD